MVRLVIVEVDVGNAATELAEVGNEVDKLVELSVSDWTVA